MAGARESSRLVVSSRLFVASAGEQSCFAYIQNLCVLMFLLNMCSLICELSYVCSPALICVFSNACSHLCRAVVCPPSCAVMCVFSCVRSRVRKFAYST